MKTILCIACLILCLAATKRVYEVTCPDCKKVYQLPCAKEICTGGYSVSNGVIQRFSLDFKCPAKHKFTSWTERFVETLPMAKEVKLNCAGREKQ